MAKTICLISCVSQKLSYKAPVKDFYISTLFKGNLTYAKKQNPDHIFILSAKYGLLELTDEIEPYDVTLIGMKQDLVKAWAYKVLEQLKTKTDLDSDRFIFLAGDIYRKYLIPYMKNYEVPLEGLGIGKQLQFHSEANKKKTQSIMSFLK